MKHELKISLLVAAMIVYCTVITGRFCVIDMPAKATEPPTEECVAVETPQIIMAMIDPDMGLVDPGAVNAPARNERYADVQMTDAEMEELAKVICLEAGNQSETGQQAIAEVVFNRVKHDGFPDNVHDVLHQYEGTNMEQFSTIRNIDIAKPTQAQYDAVDGALYGKPILDPDVVFFSRYGENDRVWGQIGDHVFCREYIWE